jgi:tetratricopeptide (TPR) repeat protein
MTAGNYTAAISTLQAAVPGNPSSAELFYWLGRAYYEVRDWDSAVAQGEKSTSLDAKSSLYHDWLGREYGGKADRDRSFSMAKKVKSEFRKPFSSILRISPRDVTLRNIAWTRRGSRVGAKTRRSSK